jgi:hypothetical protein
MRRKGQFLRLRYQIDTPSVFSDFVIKGKYSIMKIRLFTLLIALCLTGCKTNSTTKGVNSAKSAINVDKSIIAILPFNDYVWLVKGVRAIKLSGSDLKNIEILLHKCVEAYNILQKHENRIDFAKYKRQYIAFTNQKGERVVWVNCFCETFDDDIDWTKHYLLVEDGGNCFFNLEINLSQNNYYDFMVNGYG